MMPELTLEQTVRFEVVRLFPAACLNDGLDAVDAMVQYILNGKTA